MAFASAADAKEFLARKIVSEARAEGIPFSDEDRKLLYFTEEDPRTAFGISEERLTDDDSDYEERVTELLRNAYRPRDYGWRCDLVEEPPN